MTPILRRRRLTAFTLIELLVVIAIVGTLVGLLMPAVQVARESARFAECQSHLRQIGLATMNFHETFGVYPPARLRSRFDTYGNTCDSTQPSWLVRILPFIEERDQYSKWDLYGRFEDHPPAVRAFVPSIYVCPTRRTVQDAFTDNFYSEQEYVYPCGCALTEVIQVVSGAVGDYAGNHGDFTGGSYNGPFSYWRGGNGTGVIISSRPLCNGALAINWLDKIRSKDILDGLSHTFLAGEMHVPTGRLAQPPENGPIYNGKDLPAFGRIGGPGMPLARGPDDVDFPALGFGSWHTGVCPFVAADGSVRIIDNFIDDVVLGNYCTRADGGQ